MPGELQLSQFRYTITNNNDFVIGDPGDSSTDPRYLVFQVTNLPGYSSNPHIKCYKDGAQWKLAYSTTGSNTLELVTSGTNNIFTGTNAFSNNVVFSSTVTFTSSSSVLFEGNQIFLHVGQAGNCTNAGLVVEENGGTQTAKFIVNDARTGWLFLSPASAYTLQLLHPTNNNVVASINATTFGTTGNIASEAYVGTQAAAAVTANRMANPRYTNFRYYLDDLNSVNVLKQPVFRIPDYVKLTGLYIYKNNTTSNTANMSLSMNLGATAVTMQILGNMASKAWIDRSTLLASLPDEATLGEGDSIFLNSITVTTAGELKDISIEIVGIYDFA